MSRENIYHPVALTQGEVGVRTSKSGMLRNGQIWAHGEEEGIYLKWFDVLWGCARVLSFSPIFSIIAIAS